MMTKGSCLYVFTVSMATFRMAVEAGMVVKEEPRRVSPLDLDLLFQSRVSPLDLDLRFQSRVSPLDDEIS